MKSLIDLNSVISKNVHLHVDLQETCPAAWAILTQEVITPDYRQWGSSHAHSRHASYTRNIAMAGMRRHIRSKKQCQDEAAEVSISLPRS